MSDGEEVVAKEYAGKYGKDVDKEKLGIWYLFVPWGGGDSDSSDSGGGGVGGVLGKLMSFMFGENWAAWVRFILIIILIGVLAKIRSIFT